MRKVLSLSLGALAVLLLTVALLGCGGGKSAPTGTNLKSMPDGSSQDVDNVLAELDALEPPEGVDPALFEQLKEELARRLNAGGGKIVSTPSDYAINDFLEVDPVTDPPTVTWSSDALIADGSLNGVVGIEDITPIAMHYGEYWFPEDGGENLEAKVADYNRDYTVGIADITPLAMTFGQDTAGFIVEWAEDENENDEPDEPDAAYSLGGQVDYGDMLPEQNENGFNVWEFQFAAGQLPDVDGVWARVVPYDGEDTRGLANDPAIWIELEVVEPPAFYVTDILVQVTGTTNTEAGSDYEGTEYYAAPAAGGDTFGEAAANQHILMVLSDIAFLYDGDPYPFGTYPDDLPDGLTVEDFDAAMIDLQGFMDYTVESTEVPPDAEAWAEDAQQPAEGYAGTLGPNDPGSLLLTADMPDNNYTQGSASFMVTIDLSLTEDVNAPEVRSFEPGELPQNKNEIITVRMHWGDDEVGTELPETVALYDTSDWSVTYTFVPDEEPETPDMPDEPGEYTIQRVPPNPEFTTNISVFVSGGWFEMGKEYKWRVSEMDDDFERRSSLKKPDTTLTVTGPEYFDTNTWPEEEFYTLDSRQPFLYFFPEDPLIRRNPDGHPTMDDPPAFEPDDGDAFDDMIRVEGEEFTVLYGSLDPPTPESPMVWYSWGATPPATIDVADGELPISYRQPYMLAGAVAVLHDDAPPGGGEISFSLFSKEGTLLGSVTRLVGPMQITRSAPLILDGDFGVRPWGEDGTAEAPDFSDKTADQSERDVVIFTFYNSWLRHNDAPGIPEAERSTHLILVDAVSSAELPDIVLEPRMVGTVQGGLCYCAIEVGRNGNTDPEQPGPFGRLWWQNITQLIPIAEYEVTIENAGAGSAAYGENLHIVP